MNRWIVVLTLVFSFGASQAFAGSSTTIPLYVDVAEQLELHGTIYEGEVGSPTTVTQMAFGTLVGDTLGGPLRATKYFTVFMTASASSRRYEVKMSAAALNNGAGATLPAGACIVTPHSNGLTLPAGSQLGTRGTFVATDKMIYRSEPAGSTQSMAAAFAITNNPAFGAFDPMIPADQRGGSYTSAVTFTMTLI